jgi:hypothetical protein
VGRLVVGVVPVAENLSNPPDVFLAVVVWSSLSGRASAFRAVAFGAIAFGHIGADGLVSSVSLSMSWDERMPDIVPKVNFRSRLCSTESALVSLYRE